MLIREKDNIEFLKDCSDDHYTIFTIDVGADDIIYEVKYTKNNSVKLRRMILDKNDKEYTIKINNEKKGLSTNHEFPDELEKRFKTLPKYSDYEKQIIEYLLRDDVEYNRKRKIQKIFNEI